MIELTLPGVYRITDTATGRFYIGSSINLRARARHHVYRLRQGKHPNPALQAIWLVDPSRLRWDVVEVLPSTCTKSQILAAEQQYLDAAGVGTRKCLNVLAVAGSHLGRKRSAETRRRLADAQRGRTATPEARERMRVAKVGKSLSEEHRKKLGDAARGKKLPPRERLPRPELRRFSDPQVREIRAAKAAGSSFSAIEAKYQLSRGALQRMLTRQTYAEVE